MVSEDAGRASAKHSKSTGSARAETIRRSITGKMKRAICHLIASLLREKGKLIS